jgi:hypothetical protein
VSGTRRKARVDVVDLVDLRGKRSATRRHADTPTRPYAHTPALAPSSYLRAPCPWTLNLFL